MVDSFLTVEDINTTLFSNQGFWWHKLEVSQITNKDSFDWVKLDFCEVKREQAPGNPNIYAYSVKINNNYWTKGWYAWKNNTNTVFTGSASFSDGVLSILNAPKDFTIFLYMGLQSYSQLTSFTGVLLDTSLELDYKELSNEQNVHVRILSQNREVLHPVTVSVGINDIENIGDHYGFLLVNLLKTDFQFQCDQQLTLGEVNTVKLGALTDYKPNGDLVGEYTPTIEVYYDGDYIPVTFNSNLNDYVFDLDLTNKQNEGKVRFTVIVQVNEVINESETDVVLDAKYETINTFNKLQTLFKNGGVGRIGADITLTNDLTLSESVLIIGNERTLNMTAHKIIVPSDKTFKAENITFNNGKNTIQQQINSIVELNNCEFTGATGFGSVIDCQVDMENLTDDEDFITTLNNCTITNSDMAILHGGQLTVIKCTVNGKIADKNSPFFLYQTDGDAILTDNEFKLISPIEIDYDIEFNTCIFTCGDNATINELNHTDLQNNGLTAFLTAQRNRSTIDVTYFYNLIGEYITLTADKGYCHSVSGVDYVFKTNTNIRRN